MSSDRSPNKTAFIRIQGGLGNQMFQLTLGHILQAYREMNVTYFSSHEVIPIKALQTPRKILLREFPNLSKVEIRNIRTLSKKTYSAHMKRKLGISKNEELLIEPRDGNPIDFMSLNIENDIILDGYWQDITYPTELNAELNQVFQFPVEKKIKLKAIIDKVSAPSAVSVHVRRGDYLASNKSKNFHGVCSEAYFEEGIKFLSRQIEGQEVFFFTDDPRWVQERFGHLNGTLVSELGLTDFEEMMTLSFAQNIVISNSTFSWWAAYLHDRSRFSIKRVVAPYPWFIGTAKSPNYQIDWHRIDPRHNE